MCLAVVVQSLVFGIWTGLLALFNGLQLILHIYNRRPVTSLPLIFQRYTTALGLTYFISHTLSSLTTRMNFTIFSIHWCFISLSQFISLVMCTHWAYETTRNAYLAIYIERENIVIWPFVLCCVMSGVSLTVASVLRVETNREKYTAISNLVISFHIIIVALYIVYYCRQLRISLQKNLSQPPNSGSDPNDSLSRYWYFTIVMCVGILLLSALLILEAFNMVKQDALFYDPSQLCVFHFAILAFFRNFLLTILTVWSWRKISSASQMISPASTRSAFTHLGENVTDSLSSDTIELLQSQGWVVSPRSAV
eukprot:TRINITY_DN6129_c0_g1_i1.p1 TRINITY_DN6129_c0_g1~~TRINITY_DN6129_c0_g1_i1.p1  ORF type:complete len:333 (-),score=32.87 TRINITY_DN6129_c0_g1_i1:122-1048(-)